MAEFGIRPPWKCCGTTGSASCRTRRDDPRQSVLIVLPAAEYPTPGTLRRLANEYGVILNLMINAVEAISGDGRRRANCSSARPRLSRTCLSQCGIRG